MNPLTNQQLDDIQTKTAELRQRLDRKNPWPADNESHWMAEGWKNGTRNALDKLHPAALVDEVRRLRAELDAATEFRLTPAPPAYTPLIVRRDPAYDGTQWAVLHDPGDLAVRRTWTAEGWEMTWSSSHDEIFCWPDAASALAAARQAQGEDDREPDVDGAGRTPESYRETPAQGATGPVSA